MVARHTSDCPGAKRLFSLSPQMRESWKSIANCRLRRNRDCSETDVYDMKDSIVSIVIINDNYSLPCGHHDLLGGIEPLNCVGNYGGRGFSFPQHLLCSLCNLP